MPRYVPEGIVRALFERGLPANGCKAYKDTPAEQKYPKSTTGIPMYLELLLQFLFFAKLSLLHPGRQRGVD